MEASNPLLRVVGVSKSFRNESSVSAVINDLSLELTPGSVTSLLGPSGTGKSTLLSLIAGLLHPDSGAIFFRGTDIATLDESTCARLRAKHFGIVPQRGALVPYLTAAENVHLAMKIAGLGRVKTRTAVAHLVEFGVAHRADHLPREMSGGEAVRVALAMALATDPELILADEATGELDPETAKETMDIILRRSLDRGVTLLYVTHSLEISGYADRCLALTDNVLRAM